MADRNRRLIKETHVLELPSRLGSQRLGLYCGRTDGQYHRDTLSISGIQHASSGSDQLFDLPSYAVGDPKHLIGVQSVVIGPADRLRILAPATPPCLTVLFPLPPSAAQNSSASTPPTSPSSSPSSSPKPVAFPISCRSDVRFDLRPSLTPSGGGVAYITDSSSEGPNRIVIVDLSDGSSWRRLNNVPSARPEPGFFLQVWGTPTYLKPGQGQLITPITFGWDGITLSADGETLYYCVVSSRYLYSVPTQLLRSQYPPSELLTADAAQQLTQKGVSDGLESDTNDIVCAGSFKTNSIVTSDPANRTAAPLVRDPRIDRTDTMSVSADGYLYFTENPLLLAPSQQGGVDKRVKPWKLYRVPLRNGDKQFMLK